jgi:hypothetical protein
MPEPRHPRSLLDHFSALKDPREGWRILYPLREVLLVVLCATLAGMEDFVEIKLFCVDFIPLSAAFPRTTR